MEIIKTFNETINSTKYEVDNEYYFTTHAPKQSSRLVYYLLITAVIAIILSCCIRHFYRDSYFKVTLEVFMILVSFILALTAGSLILRIINFFTELENINTDYDGQFVNILRATFDFNMQSIILIILSCIFIFIFKFWYSESIRNCVERHNNQSICLFLILLASIILCQSISLFGSISNIYHGLNTAHEGVDYGTGMAFSYFYGYLRIILPSNGGDNSGIRFKMEIYDDKHGVQTPIKKLFILIPESGYIPPDLKEVSDNWLEGTTSLRHEVRDRAGTKNRIYHNTVYKIHPGGEGKNHRPIYVVVEGATPILTLHEIIKHYHKQTAVYRKNRKAIIAAFYNTLQELLNSDPECRDVCELIYYKDYNNGKKVNVGELLLNIIRKSV